MRTYRFLASKESYNNKIKYFIQGFCALADYEYIETNNISDNELEIFIRINKREADILLEELLKLQREKDVYINLDKEKWILESKMNLSN